MSSRGALQAGSRASGLGALLVFAACDVGPLTEIHDGGAPPTVSLDASVIDAAAPDAAPSCGDRVCPDFLPFCRDGTCVACETCCPEGFHEGGDGRCLPEGDCARGYARAYADLDGDGVGAGPLLPDCRPVPPPEGRSATGDDCNDDDRAVFKAQDAYPDVDRDGYTASVQSLCTGGALPDGWSEVPRPAPFVSFQPRGSTPFPSNDDEWRNVSAISRPDDFGASSLFRSGETEVLFASGFHLEVPDGAEILGVVVHVRRRAEGVSRTTDASMRLATSPTALSEERANGSRLWSSTWETVMYGGPSDTWGRRFSPQALRSSEFGVALAADGGLVPGGRVFVDHVFVQVFANVGEDCDDDDAKVYSSRVVYADLDDDGFGFPKPVQVCVGTELEDAAENGDDCYDENDEAFPGQTEYFGVDRGDGRFDFDCDRIDSPEALQSHDTCFVNPFGDCIAMTSHTVMAAACGLPNSLAICGGNDCTPRPATVPTACR